MINRSKPNSTQRTECYDFSKSKYWLFTDDQSLSISQTIDYDTLQGLISDGTLRLIEVLNVVDSSAEKLTGTVGNRTFALGAGEQSYSGNVKTAYGEDLSGYNYYCGGGLVVITEDNQIIGTPSGSNITPIPLSQVWNVEKPILHTGEDIKMQQLSFTVQGLLANSLDEYTLPFNATALEPTISTEVTDFHEDSQGAGTLTVQGLNSTSPLDASIGTITSGIDDYIEVDGDSISAITVTSSTVSVTLATKTWQDETSWTFTLKQDLFADGYEGCTYTHTV